MKAEEVIAIAYSRGLRPCIDKRRKSSVPTLTFLEWDGGEISEALSRMFTIHNDRIMELVSSGWVPPTVGEAGFNDSLASNSQDTSGRRSIDPEAERAVRDLYGCGVSIRWKTDGMDLIRGPRTNLQALEQVLARVRPLRDRVHQHLSPGSQWSGWLELLNECYPDGHCCRVHRREYDLGEGTHPFRHRPGIPFSAWRYLGERDWRMLWGYYLTDDDGRQRWRSWGH